MEVTGPGSVSGALPIKPTPPGAQAPKPEQTKPVPAGDEVEISSAGKMLDKLNQSPEVHAERLAQIKAAIQAGEYETSAKLEAAVQKLLDEIGVDGE